MPPTRLKSSRADGFDLLTGVCVNSCEIRPPVCRKDAFSRLDLLFLIGGLAVVLIVGWLGLAVARERVRTSRCARNLGLLGEGMQSYTETHQQSLPPALVWTPELKTAWDTRLMTVLNSTSGKEDTRPALFVCPSDIVRRDSPRSYAMARHDMRPENWPPGPDNITGVGLAWTAGLIAKYLPESKNAEGPTIDELSLVKVSMIRAPADTLLLSELISAENKFRSTAQPGVEGAAKQQECLKERRSTFHGGRLNYLMVDGHVERLSALETGALEGAGGIWTIKPGD
jgi:prepilin-type processing-associated H-X9-DG protein